MSYALPIRNGSSYRPLISTRRRLDDAARSLSCLRALPHSSICLRSCPRQRFWRISSRRLSILAFATFATLVPATAAHAGIYTIGDCPSAFNRTSLAGPWQFFGQTNGTILKTECGGNPAAIFFAIAELPATPMGFRASTNGTNLSIVNARVWWRAFGSPSAEVEAETEATDAAGELLAVGQWDGNGELVEQMSAPEEFHFPAADHATTLVLAEHCYLGGKCPMTESFGVGIEIFGAELTLNDEMPPAVSITGVQNEGATAFSGPIQTTFTVSDPDAGVQNAELLLDGTPIATHNYISSCSFTKLTPCPGTISDRFAGISLPEGGNELAVRVIDAAGNTSVAPVPHIANGVPCANPTIALTANRHKLAVTVPFGRGATVAGRLACGSTPVPGATVLLGTATLPGSPDAFELLRTAVDGTFRYQLPPGPSRKLLFSYRAYSNESTPTTQSAVQVNVRPSIRLHITPRRTHDGGTIHWRGQVQGGPYPPNGMPLLVQVKEGKRWQTFDEIKVRGGKIAYSYTFLRTSRPTTYSFRVALPTGGDVGYPYATGASGKVNVHVR